MRKNSFAHNSILNFSSQVLLIVIALICIPFIISRLGSETFGLLSILWLFVGYFTFLDLGIGQATVKFLSEGVARDQSAHAASILQSSLKLALIIGFVGCAAIVLLSFLDIGRFMNVGSNLRPQATVALRWLALCLPAVLAQGVLRSVPLAHNRFDLMNILQAAAGSLQWAGSAFVLYLGGGFTAVVLLTAISRYLILCAYILVAVRVLPGGFQRLGPVEKWPFTKLLRFGSWVTISQIIGPMLTLLERLIIGSVISLAWVTFYSVPYDAVMKLVIIPMSFATALFPLVSGSWLTDEGRARARAIYHRSIKYIFTVMLPIAMLGILFSSEILNLWLGKEFSEKSGWVMSIFSAGLLFHALSQLPNTILWGIGRPDLTAKLLLAETPLYLLACWFATSRFGIYGTAAVWLIRIVIETSYLFIAVWNRTKSIVLGFDFSYLWKGAGMILAGGTVLALMRLGTTTVFMQVISIALFLLTYAIGMWRFSFDERDKDQMRSLIQFGYKSGA